MINIDITSDIERAMMDVDTFFRGQIPFATVGALNNTIFDVRKRIVNSTYPKAFTVRNRAFPGRLWRVTQKANKKDMVAMLTQTTERGNMELHVSGGVRKPQGGHSIAVPVNINRTKTGRVPAAQRASRLRSKKNVFVTQGRGGNRLVMERSKQGGVTLKHVLTDSAKIGRSFRFYEDATDTVLRVFSGHWNSRMNYGIATSRFTRR